MVYAPALYKPDKAACVMIFQDGSCLIAEDGRWRVPVVFDNLISRHEMPVTIGIFINPGVLPIIHPSSRAATTAVSNTTRWATATSAS